MGGKEEKWGGEIRVKSEQSDWSASVAVEPPPPSTFLLHFLFLLQSINEQVVL